MREINHRLSGGKKKSFIERRAYKKKSTIMDGKTKREEINAYRTRIYNIKGDLFAVLLQ